MFCGITNNDDDDENYHNLFRLQMDRQTEVQHVPLFSITENDVDQSQYKPFKKQHHDKAEYPVTSHIQKNT